MLIMKYCLLAKFFWGLILISQCALAQVTFQKSYQLESNAYVSRVEQTEDGGFIMLDDTCHLVRTDSEGNILWDKSYEIFGYESGESVKQTLDGGYIVCGAAEYTGTSDIFLIKTDENGNIQWSKTYDEGFADDGRDVQQTNDGGYIICGTATFYNYSPRGFTLIKTDSIGNVLWSYVYYPTLFATCDGDGCIKETNDGGFVMAISVSVVGGLFKTDSIGNFEWAKTYGDTDVLEYYLLQEALDQTKDGGYITTCVPDGKTVLIKTDSVGNILWTKKYDDVDYNGMYSIHRTQDDGFILAGVDGAGYDFVTCSIKADSAGNLLWSKQYGIPTHKGELRSCTQTSDKGYAFLGWILQSGLYFIKTDSNGNTNCDDGTLNFVTSDTSIAVNSLEFFSVSGISTGTQVITTTSYATDSTYCLTYTSSPSMSDEKNKVVISPNPFDQFSTIYFPTGEKFDFVLYDVFGKEIINLKDVSGNTVIQKGSLPPGIYFYRISANEKKFSSGKLVAE